MAILDLDPDGLRRVGELVDTAGTMLNADLGEDVPGCGGDDVSQAIVDNLNARRRWLADHVRAGYSQVVAAADGVDATAAAYQAEDAAAAGRYGEAGGYGAGAAPAGGGGAAPGVSAPTGPPSIGAIPDISGRDGEELAQALESGAGTGPVTAAATRCAGLALQAQNAAATLLAAQAQLVASGQSEAHGPLMARLTRATAWTQAVAGHADALAAGYTAAAASHTATMGTVGPSAGWRALKTAYNEALAESAATGGLAQPRVDALAAALTEQQQQAGTAVTGYQGTGQTVSTPPGDLPDPGLNPNGHSAPADDSAVGDEDKKKKPSSELDDAGSGAQDMLSPIMGAVGPLMQCLSKANPLQSLGQAAQQLGQQAAKMAEGKNPAGSPIKPAALAQPRAAAAKGGGGGGKGLGGGGGIKPGSGIGGAVHPAALGGTPATTPPPASVKPAAAAGTSAGGMGMMPMGHRPGDSKTSKVNSYEQPLPEVDGTGRPGVVGDTARPAPTVDPEAQNAVRARIARRKKDAAGDDA